MRAHQQMHQVTVRGNLVRRGTRSYLANSTGFRILGTTEAAWWVIDASTVELIAAERDLEVRRFAIERIGWPAFIAAVRSLPRSRRPRRPLPA